MHLVVARASETAGCGGRPLTAATVKGERATRPPSFERGKEEGVLKAAFFVCFVVLRGSRFCLFPLKGKAREISFGVLFSQCARRKNRRYLSVCVVCLSVCLSRALGEKGEE